MRRLICNPRVRTLGAALVAIGLAVAVYLQRATIFDAIGEIRQLPQRTVLALVGFAVLERVSRAEVIRSLLPELTLRRAEMISDVGSAASKGIPAGGPIATVLRWQLARERGVDAARFIVMLTASGVATAFVSWGYPLVATLIDMAGRDGSLADIGIVAVSGAVICGSALFWFVALRSERAHRYTIERSAWILARLPAIASDATDADADTDADTDTDSDSERAVRLVETVSDELRSVARRPAGLLARTLIAQGTGAVILWVALAGLGVGDELGATEFARVFFVAHILGSLAPTPGGVGVIEAGVTGALVAAGVAADVALAGVLVYRFITYVLPIIIGTIGYLIWRARPSSGDADGQVGSPVRSGRDAVH